MARNFKDGSIMLTKEEFITNKVKLVEEDSTKGKILMMYPLDKEDCNSYPLMYEREKETIEKRVMDLCEKYKPKKVLEIGFGLGYTATTFQKYGIKEHIIVEPHPKIFKEAVKWANKYQGKSRIQLVQSFIQDFKYDEKGYDLIFDDRYELVYENNSEGEAPRYKIRGLAGWGILFTKEDRAQFKKR